jgi:hypothetical protein
MTIELAHDLDEVRSRQLSDAIRGALVYGFLLEGFPTEDALFAVERLARELSLVFLYGQAAAESAEDDDLLVGPWVVGVELQAVSGGAEQEQGFTFAELAAGVEEAKPRVAEAHRAFLEACAGYPSQVLRDRTPIEPSEPELHIVALGALSLASVLKGEWVAPPKMDEENDWEAAEAARDAWFAKCRESYAAPGGGVGYRYGTVGASQTPYRGGVHGISVGGADQTSESISITAESDAALDRALVAAGIVAPRYFILTKFD